LKLFFFNFSIFHCCLPFFPNQFSLNTSWWLNSFYFLFCCSFFIFPFNTNESAIIITTTTNWPIRCWYSLKSRVILYFFCVLFKSQLCNYFQQLHYWQQEDTLHIAHHSLFIYVDCRLCSTSKRLIFHHYHPLIHSKFIIFTG
jgi:hypothetical protein